MKLNEKYYTEVVSEELSDYYDKKKYGTPENFCEIVGKSVKETIKFYTENFDLDEDFDSEVFVSDLISDAKKALK